LTSELDEFKMHTRTEDMETVIEFKLPQEILFSLREDKEQFVVETRKILAIKYFQDKKLSIGQCSLLANMTELNFIKLLSEQKLSIFRFDTEDELFTDYKNA
jgi:predicted HTH domain antitoxin